MRLGMAQGYLYMAEVSGIVTQLLLPENGLFPHISPVARQLLHCFTLGLEEKFAPRQGSQRAQHDPGISLTYMPGLHPPHWDSIGSILKLSSLFRPNCMSVPFTIVSFPLSQVPTVTYW